MDYSKMNDQEINQLVGKVVSRDGLSIIASDGNAVIHEYSDCGYFKGVCLGWKVFDPCINPEDAWPIIVNDRIGLNFVNSTWRAQSMKTGWVEYCHENPLRAAMIVYLQMQESANVQDNPA